MAETDYSNNPAAFPGCCGEAAALQCSIDAANGASAALTGQAFTIYRSTASGDFIQTANIIGNLPVWREQLAKKDLAFETDQALGTYWYGLTLDASTLLEGDVLIETGGIAGKDKVTFSTPQFNGICLAGKQDLKTRIGARLDRQARIYRSSTEPDPTSKYADSTIKAALPVVCNDGVYSAGLVTDIAAFIPIGIMGEKKSGKGAAYPGLPDSPARTSWKIYVVPLNGFSIREGDFIVAEDGVRYRVQNPYTQDTGLVGSQLLCDRTGVETANPP